MDILLSGYYLGVLTASILFFIIWLAFGSRDKR